MCKVDFKLGLDVYVCKNDSYNDNNIEKIILITNKNDTGNNNNNNVNEKNT